MSAPEDTLRAPEVARRRMGRGLRHAGRQRLAFLAKASARLAESLDYEATLQGLAELVVPRLADWCGIDVVAEDGAVEQLAVAHRDPERVAWARELRRRYPLDPAAPSGILAVLSNGRSQLVPHITDAMLQAAARDAEHLELLRKAGFSSLMIVPLVARGQTLGALSLVFAETGRHYTRSDLALAEELARRAALAVDNARLYREARLARAGAERLHAVGDALSAALTPEAVARVIIGEGLTALGADAGAVYALDDEGATCSVLGYRGYAAVADPRYLRVRVDAPGPLSEAMRSGQLVAVESPAELLARWPHLADARRQSGDAATVAVPLLADGRVLGVLYAAFRQPRRFSVSDRTFLTTLARQCALALDRARLYAAEHAAQHRTREVLDALLAMAQLLVQAPNEAEDASSEAGLLGQRLAELTCHVLSCRRASITTYDPITGGSLPLAVAGATPDEEERWRSGQPGATLREYLDAAQLARLRREELLILDAADVPERRLPYGVQTLLLALMRVGQHVVGVLALDHGGEAHVYTPEEQALARAVARLIGLVIERERLLHEREAARGKARALREANRRMEEFLGLASHELRTPLTSIRGSLQIMQRRLDRALDAEGRRDAADAALGRLSPLLDRAIAQTGVLNGLVGDLLDVSLIQAGQLRLHLAPRDLLGLVRQVVEDQRELAPGRAIALERPPMAALAVQMDAERLAQVLTNYLDNALKYSTEDQPVSVGVEMDAEASTVRVWVRDAGPGVEVADQRRIWERFHRVEGVGHRFGSSVGLGLGLYISRTIMERHGGQVGVESAPGAGATFWFTLPLSR